MANHELVVLKAALEFVPVKIDYSTLWRWSQGVRGRRLKTVTIGGRLYTTRAWVEEFLAEAKPVLASQQVPNFLRPANAAPEKSRNQRKPRR